MKFYVISDTHFNHKKIIEYENRPLDFNEQIIRNWNKKVNDHDIVIHLGDVILGHDSELPEIMRRLNGTKILARGNHDHHNDDWYMERGFDFVVDYYVYKNIAFSHAPITPLPIQVNRQKTGTPEWEERLVDLNIHGHLHRMLHRGEEFPDRYYDYKYFKANRSKYHLIQIEDSLSPFLLDDILKQHEKAPEGK